MFLLIIYANSAGETIITSLTPLHMHRYVNYKILVTERVLPLRLEFSVIVIVKPTSFLS